MTEAQSIVGALPKYLHFYDYLQIEIIYLNVQFAHVYITENSTSSINRHVFILPSKKLTSGISFMINVGSKSSNSCVSLASHV